MKLPQGLGELCYCSNIHPGESLDEVRANLRVHSARVKARVSPAAPMGIGLRLSARAAAELNQPGALEQFRELLAQLGLYVFTLNGFPYGNFHGVPVKAGVYEPDWSSRLRLDYTRELASILRQLLPPGVTGSISTLPCCFRPKASVRALERCAEQLLQQTAFLHAVARDHGQELQLALEPEPYCALETTAEARAFFERYLLRRSALRRFAMLAAVGNDEAERVLRRHLGVCLDTCHAAVEFESADESVAMLAAAGIAIAKVQLSAGLRLAHGSVAARQELARFDDGVYLHQVVVCEPSDAPPEAVDQPSGARRGAVNQSRLVRFLDLPQALSASAVNPAAEWRVHCHVPIFLDAFGELSSTQAYVTRLLELQRERPITQHLEVETYTWEVLPSALRSVSVDAAIARELSWVRSQLGLTA